MTEFTIQESNGITIFTAAGKLVMGPATAAIRDAIHNFLHTKRIQIVLDLKDVAYIDSCALGELVAASTAVRQAGGEVKLVKSPHVRDILVIAKLYGVFEIFEDAASAVRSFGNVWPQYLWRRHEEEPVA